MLTYYPYLVSLSVLFFNHYLYIFSFDLIIIHYPYLDSYLLSFSICYIARYEYVKLTYSYRYGKRSQMFIRIYRNPKTLEIGSGTKLLFTFLSLRFLDMIRERYNFFLSWLFHLTPTTCGTPAADYWSGLGELRKSTCFVQVQISTNCFFSNSKILSASGHDVIHIPSHIFYLGFLLWHLWLSHPPCPCMNTCTQCCAPN